MRKTSWMQPLIDFMILNWNVVGKWVDFDPGWFHDIKLECWEKLYDFKLKYPGK